MHLFFTTYKQRLHGRGEVAWFLVEMSPTIHFFQAFSYKILAKREKLVLG
jgi:hypothetical protein